MSLIPLLRHHIARAAAGAAYNALEHCHAQDLHSIVLHDEPGNRVRIFYADWEHTLERNRSGKFTLAIHPHHCDLKFVGLFGHAHNDIYALTPNAFGEFHEMEYKSAITTGSGSLTRTGKTFDVHLLKSEPLAKHPELKAHQLHTIHCSAGVRSAWMVIEGAESSGYESLCYTNDPDPNLRGLYNPMDSKQVAYRLTEIVQQMERAAA